MVNLLFRMGSSSVSVLIFSHLIRFLLSTNSLFVNPFFSLSVIVSLCASFNEDIRVVADPITASLSRCLSITTKRRTVSDSPGWMEKDWEKEGEPVLNFTFVQYAFSPLWHFCEIVRLEKSLESLFLDFHPRLP